MKNSSQPPSLLEIPAESLDFDKFYHKLVVIHDKELYLSLKTKESYYNLLYKCYDEIKSINMLNYNRKTAFSIQIDALKLAVKSRKSFIFFSFPFDFFIKNERNSL